MAGKIKKQKTETPDLVTVTLVKDHTHEGEPRKKGERIKVAPDKTAWLKTLGVIEK